MNKLIWALQIVVAAGFLAAGGMKLSQPRAELVSAGMGWAQDFPDAAVKAIGAAEVAGAIGLVVPYATGIVPMLTPLAGACLALLMAGAVNVHVGRGEDFTPALALGLLAAAVAVMRFRRT